MLLVILRTDGGKSRIIHVVVVGVLAGGTVLFFIVLLMLSVDALSKLLKLMDLFGTIEVFNPNELHSNTFGNYNDSLVCAALV